MRIFCRDIETPANGARGDENLHHALRRHFALCGGVLDQPSEKALIRGTGGHERGDVNEAGLASGRCTHHFWVCCLRGLGSCSVASLSVSSLPLQGSLLPERLMPAAESNQSHAVFTCACSVLDGRPCTPSFCSVFNHGPCIPEIDYPMARTAADGRKRAVARRRREIPKARPRSRHHRRPLCRAAVLLVAAAG